MIIVEVIRV